MPTPPKLGLRARLKAYEAIHNQLKLNSDNATIVANACFWKLGLRNREEIKAVVDEYMAHMQAEVSKLKEQRSLQVMPDFIDPAILAKVAEHADSTVTHDSAE